MTVTLATGAVHEYPYLLENPATTADASSEITALSNTQFVVLERDGNLPPAANRKLFYKIDITGATDVGPSSTLANSTYDGANGGLLLTDQSNKTIEAFVGPVTTADAQSALVTRGIAPVSKQLYLDLSATSRRSTRPAPCSGTTRSKACSRWTAAPSCSSRTTVTSASRASPAQARLSRSCRRSSPRHAGRRGVPGSRPEQVAGLTDHDNRDSHRRSRADGDRWHRDDDHRGG